jgi:hypothetical protein
MNPANERGTVEQVMAFANRLRPPQAGVHVLNCWHDGGDPHDLAYMLDGLMYHQWIERHGLRQ